MRRIWRLLHYARPYALYTLASVVLMALVGAMAGLRIFLIKPIFDKVLRPEEQSADFLSFRVPWINRWVDLHFLVPSHFHNAWSVVAYALVASALVKSICDYAGTYLVNYAGFGMITDLRNDLYDAILRRSVAFFQKHTTGMLLSTIINDIEKVQFAMSTIMADFLQQFFTLLAMTAVAISFGGKLAWVLLLFVPVVISSARRIGRRVRSTTRKGQDKLAEIQNILHETITGNPIVKAFGMEGWEMDRFRSAAGRLFHANLRSVSVQAISSPLMDAIGSVGIALLLLFGRQEIQRGAMTLPDRPRRSRRPARRWRSPRPTRPKPGPKKAPKRLKSPDAGHEFARRLGAAIFLVMAGLVPAIHAVRLPPNFGERPAAGRRGWPGQARP